MDNAAHENPGALLSWKRAFASAACSIFGALLGVLIIRLPLCFFYQPESGGFYFTLAPSVYLVAVLMPLTSTFAIRWAGWGTDKLRKNRVRSNALLSRKNLPRDAAGNVLGAIIYAVFMTGLGISEWPAKPGYYISVAVILFATLVGAGSAYGLTRFIDNKVWFKTAPSKG